ncbi:cation channel sperm-associated protein 2 [Ctenodactylus gundi]
MGTHYQAGHMRLARADAIRSHLLDTFSFLEHLKGLSQAVPRHTVRDIVDPSRQKTPGLGDQHQLVNFSLKPQHLGRISHTQRMLSRLHVRCSQKPPLSLWADWVIGSILSCHSYLWLFIIPKTGPLFTDFIVFLIILNTVVMMLEIELQDSTNASLWPLKLTLEVVACFILLVFILEILLKWLSSFSLYWKSTWNIFDFVVTMLSVLPEIAVLGGGVTTRPLWLRLLRICRFLRSFKLCTRIHRSRIAILALTRTLKSMTILSVLLIIVIYMFALTGVYFFEDFTRSDLQDLQYNMLFSDLLNSLGTVFIIFTLDHWYALLQEIWRVPEVSRVFSGLYVVLWLLLGSVIFRNVITAMLFSGFQQIHDELHEQVTRLAAQYQADVFKQRIIQRGASQHYLYTPEVSENETESSTTEEEVQMSAKKKEEESSTSSSDATVVGLSSEAPSQGSTGFAKLEVPDYLDWETVVHQNLPALMEMDQDDCVEWPRDSLFRYFELLEKLQYNLEERKWLQTLAVGALMSLEDKPKASGDGDNDENL